MLSLTTFGGGSGEGVARFAVPGSIWERAGLDLLSLVAFGRGVGLGVGLIYCPWQHLGEGWAGFAVPGSIWERGWARGWAHLLPLAAFGRGLGWICCPWQHLGEGPVGATPVEDQGGQGPSERPLSRIVGGGPLGQGRQVSCGRGCLLIRSRDGVG